MASGSGTSPVLPPLGGAITGRDFPSFTCWRTSNLAAKEVDILDSETEHLALAQSAAGGDDRHRLVALQARVDHGSYPVGRPGHHLVLLDLPGPDRAGTSRGWRAAPACASPRSALGDRGATPARCSAGPPSARACRRSAECGSAVSAQRLRRGTRRRSAQHATPRRTSRTGAGRLRVDVRAAHEVRPDLVEPPLRVSLPIEVPDVLLALWVTVASHWPLGRSWMFALGASLASPRQRGSDRIGPYDRNQGQCSIEKVVGHVPLAQEVRFEDRPSKPLREDRDHLVNTRLPSWIGWLGTRARGPLPRSLA